MTFDNLMDRIDEEYGADTPVQLAAEARWEAAEEAIFHQDAMEARGGPLVGFDAYDDIPF